MTKAKNPCSRRHSHNTQPSGLSTRRQATLRVVDVPYQGPGSSRERTQRVEVGISWPWLRVTRCTEQSY